MLPKDTPDTGFHVYRTTRRDTAGERITAEPVRTSTNLVDRNPGEGRIYYRVRPVAAGGKEGAPSEWAAAEPGAERSNVIAVFEPAVKEGNVVPMFGDLDGDGVLDAVVRLNNGIQEMSRDPGKPVELEAFTSYGRALWRRPLVWHDHCFGSANNVPVRGVRPRRRRQGGSDRPRAGGRCRLPGRARRHDRARAPQDALDEDGFRLRQVLHAHPHGRRVPQRQDAGHRHADGPLRERDYRRLRRRTAPLWQFRSVAETNGSGSHHIDVADVDGDGRDEVFDGTTLLNPNGTVRWSIYRQHPDIVQIKHILPGSKDRQVYYAVESSVHAGAYVVDAKTGKVIWKVNREDDPKWQHAHTGWAADIWEGSPGMEMLTNRDGHTGKDTVLFAADGKILMNPFPAGGWRPVNWTGGAVRELMGGGGTQIGRFTGTAVEVLPGVKPNAAGKGSCNMVADIAGDYRDELICAVDGKVMVFSNIEPLEKRDVTRTGNREYRLWMARNIGGGYPSYFEWQP